jgi:hypothetical protein
MRVSVKFEDVMGREHGCEISSSNSTSQLELVRLLGETFRVLRGYLDTEPNDNLLLSQFADTALNCDMDFYNKVEDDQKGHSSSELMTTSLGT